MPIRYNARRAAESNRKMLSSGGCGLFFTLGLLYRAHTIRDSLKRLTRVTRPVFAFNNLEIRGNISSSPPFVNRIFSAQGECSLRAYVSQGNV